jgi:hypothetical protein
MYFPYLKLDRKLALYQHPQAQHFDTLASNPKKVRNYRQCQPNNNEKNCIRHKVRKGHKSNSAEQRNETLLFFSINKVSKTDCPENHSPKQGRSATQFWPPFSSLIIQLVNRFALTAQGLQ